MSGNRETSKDLGQVGIFNGSKCGKHLWHFLNSAKSRVDIVSPYLGSSEVAKLHEIQERGVKVSIYSMQTEEHFDIAEAQVRRELIETWKTKERFRTKIRFSLLWIAAFVLSLTMFEDVEDFVNKLQSSDIYTFSVVLPLFMASILVLWLRIFGLKRTVTKRKFRLEFPFAFHFFPNFYERNNETGIFLHSKIYIVDGQTAILGSANFTKAGLYGNYESLVRVSDSQKVREIEKYIAELIDRHYSSVESIKSQTVEIVD